MYMEVCTCIFLQYIFYFSHHIPHPHGKFLEHIIWIRIFGIRDNWNLFCKSFLYTRRNHDLYLHGIWSMDCNHLTNRRKNKTKLFDIKIFVITILYKALKSIWSIIYLLTSNWVADAMLALMTWDTVATRNTFLNNLGFRKTDIVLIVASKT